MIIQASFNQPISSEGSSMVFIPEGSHTITPMVNGKPKTITVLVSAEKGEQIAKTIQASFEARQKSNPVRAIFDFDHKDTGPAAALPTRFFYQAGRGIMVERELTGAGENAIRAKDYSYFSPVFNIGQDGVPSGLPETGPLGALVNNPAFRHIPRIAANQAANQTTETNMEDLVTCGLLTPNEAAKPNAGEIAKQRVSAMNGDTGKVAELNKKIEALEAEKKALEGKVEAADQAIQKSKEDNAESIVKAAVADGRIATQDEATQKFWKGAIISNDDAVQALSAMPKKFEDITKQVVQASGANHTQSSGSALVVAADALITSGRCKTQDEAVTVVASESPELYNEYLKTLG